MSKNNISGKSLGAKTKSILLKATYQVEDDEDKNEKVNFVEVKKKKNFNQDIDLSKFEGLEDITEKETLEENASDADDLLFRPYFAPTKDLDAFKKSIYSLDKKQEATFEETEKLAPLHLRIKATAKIPPITGFPKLVFSKPPLDTTEKGDKTVYFNGFINFPNGDLMEKGVIVLFWTSIFFQTDSPFDIAVPDIKYILLDRFSVKKVAFIRGIKKDRDSDVTIGDEAINFEFIDKETKIDFLDHFSDAYYSHKRQFPEILFVESLPIQFASGKYFDSSQGLNPEEVLYIDEKKDKIKIGSGGNPEIFSDLVKLGDSEVIYTENVSVEYLISKPQGKKNNVLTPTLINCDIVLTDSALYIYPKENKDVKEKLMSRRIAYEDFERIVTLKTESSKMEIIIKVPLDYDVFIEIKPPNEDLINILQNQIFIGIGVQNVEKDIKKSSVYLLKEEEKLNDYTDILANLKKLQNSKVVDVKAIVKNLTKVDKLNDAKKKLFYQEKDVSNGLMNNIFTIIKNERKKTMIQDLFNEAVLNRDLKTLLLINNITMKDQRWQKFFKSNNTIDDKSIPPSLYKIINEEYLLFTIKNYILKPQKEKDNQKEKEKENENEKEIQKLIQQAKSWGLIKQAEELSYLYNEEIQKNEIIKQLKESITANSYDFQKISISLQGGALLPAISSQPLYQDISHLYPFFKSLDDLKRAVLILKNESREILLKICHESNTKDELTDKLVEMKDKLQLLTKESSQIVQNLIEVVNIKKENIKSYKEGEYKKRQELAKLYSSIINREQRSDIESQVLNYIENNSEIIKTVVEAKRELENQKNIEFKEYFDFWEDLQVKKKNKGIFEETLSEAISNYKGDKIEEIISIIGYSPDDEIKREKSLEILKQWQQLKIYFMYISIAIREIKNRNCSTQILNIILTKREEFNEFLFNNALEKFNLDKEFINQKMEEFANELQKIQKKKDVETRLFNALLTLDPLNIKNAMNAVKSNELYDVTLRASLARAEKIITSNEAKMNFIAENLQEAIYQNDREKLTKLIKIAPKFKGLRSLVEQAKRQLEDVKKLKEQIVTIIEDKDSDTLDEVLEENEPYLSHHEEWEEYTMALLNMRNYRNYKISDLRQRLNLAISQRDKNQLSETIQYVEQRIIKPRCTNSKTNEIYAILDDAKKLLSNMNEYFINDLESSVLNFDHDQDEVILTSLETTSIIEIIDNRKKKRHYYIEKLEEEIKDFEKDKKNLSDKIQRLVKVISLVFFDKMKKETFWDLLIAHSSPKIQEFTKQFKQLHPKVIEPFSQSLLFLHFIITQGKILDLLKEFVTNDLQPFYDSESIIRNVKYRDELYHTFEKLKNQNFEANYDELYLSHIVSRIKENVRCIIESYKTPKKERNESWTMKIHYYVYTELSNELNALLLYSRLKSIDLWDMVEEVSSVRRKSSIDYGGILLPQLVDETNTNLKEKSKKFKYFIGAALSKNALGDILQSILNPEVLSKYYSKESLVNDTKAMKKILSYLSVLSKIDFKIKL